jgi:predicted phage terminase large subunit-like protein
VRFWDTAAKAGQRSDYWAGALLGRTPEGEWILADVIRGRWEYPEAKRRVLATAAADGAGVPVVIEESANGIALLQDLGADPAADGYLIRAEKVTAEKAVRAGAWASLAESGRFRLVRGAWNAAFLAEVETFPHGAHDDQVDAVSGAHAYLFRLSRVRKPVALAGRPRPMW